MNQDYLFFSQTHFYVMHFPRFSCDTLSRDVYHQRLDPTRKKLLFSEHCSKITSCVCTRPFMPCHQKVFVVATENCFVCLLCCSLTNFQRSNQYFLKILYLSIHTDGRGKKEKNNRFHSCNHSNNKKLSIHLTLVHRESNGPAYKTDYSAVHFAAVCLPF